VDPLSPEAAAREALETWCREATLRRLDTRWAPQLLRRFAEVVRTTLSQAPEAARRAGLVRIARTILKGAPATQLALTHDSALGRWTSAMERALSRGDQLEPLLALTSRLAVGAALQDHASLETTVILGSGGRARLPTDGRVLQGPPGRSIRVQVDGGVLRTHARAQRRAGPFEVADGDAEAGALPTVQPLSGGSLTEIVGPLERGAKCLSETSPALTEEIAALAPVLVGVSGAPDVSHSASLAEARGCVWLTPVDRPLVVAETLIHEASHLKFFLVEDVAPMVITPDPPRFEVPWRSDRRPLRAVLMGLHAWVRILEWLDTLDGGHYAQAARERAALLSQATLAASAIVRGADGLTPSGDALVEALCHRVQDR
jgi:HEXXH motif-containing protein